MKEREALSGLHVMMRRSHFNIQRADYHRGHLERKPNSRVLCTSELIKEPFRIPLSCSVICKKGEGDLRAKPLVPRFLQLLPRHTIRSRLKLLSILGTTVLSFTVSIQGQVKRQPWLSDNQTPAGFWFLVMKRKRCFSAYTIYLSSSN